MQFKNFIIISIFVGLSAFALGNRIMGKNSVFAPENFVKKAGEVADDSMEAKRIAAKNMKIRNPKSKNIYMKI